MAYYRLYFMHAGSGHITRFEEFDADDDAAALTIAEKHLQDDPLELWCGRRKVSRLDELAPRQLAQDSRSRLSAAP